MRTLLVSSIALLVLAVPRLGAVADESRSLPAQGLARYEIELKFTAIAGLISGPDVCPGVQRNGHDTLTGIVQGTERFVDDEMQYEGTLSRTTRLPFCEAWRKPGTSEDLWCTPLLTGNQARVKTTIVIPSEDNLETEVRFEPMISPKDSVNVTSACDRDMELAITEQYLESDAFSIDTRNQAVLRKLVEKGVWQDVKPRPPNQDDGWTLTVKRKLQ